MRTTFTGHRRYSITHRAVQRLRELVPAVAEDDDEALRDRLDQMLSAAEDAGKAVRTLDVMLAEPQMLIPLENFGDVFYAIIKEDTVVTVLPRGHGEEILQRGQALEQRVAAGEQPARVSERDDNWDRRRWRRDVPQPVIERVVRATNGERHEDTAPVPGAPPPPPSPEEVASNDNLEVSAVEPESAAAKSPRDAMRARGNRIIASSGTASSGTTSSGTTSSGTTSSASIASTSIASSASNSPPPASERKKPLGPVAEALSRGLDLGRRRAATLALSETLRQQPRDTSLQPLWALLGEKGLPESLTLGDLIAAVRSISG